MIIGLYDSDMSKYTHVPFNLELMKISSYYKKKGDIVALSPSLDLEKYNKIFYRKDYYDGDFPTEIVNNKDVEYGGRAFNQNNYIPLDYDIEKQKSDIYIYNIFEKQFSSSQIMKAAFSVQMRAQHLRLSLDGTTVWKDFEKQINIIPKTQTLFFHDYNLNNIENSDIIIKEIMNSMQKYNRNLAVKFPIQVNNEKDLFKWCSFKPSQYFFLMEYQGLMSDEVLVDFIERQKGTSIASQLNYCITKDSVSEEDFIQNKLPVLFKQITYLRNIKQKVNLKYEDNFFKNKQWEELIRFFQSYLNVSYMMKKEKFIKTFQYDSLYNFAYHLRKNPCNYKDFFSKQDARELFQLVRENNFDVFVDFYKCHTVKLKGGKFQNE